MDRGLTKTAGVGRRGRSVGRSRGASPVVRSREIAVWWGLGIEYNVGHLAGPPLVLEEGEELPRGATGIEMGEPDRDERAVPAPLVSVEAGCGAGPVSHVVLAQNIPRSRGKPDRCA